MFFETIMKKLAPTLLILLSSCYSHKKALRQVIKADVSYPDVVSGYCGSKFPPKVSTNTITKTIQGKDNTDTFTVYDTLIDLQTKYINHYRVDTVIVHQTDTVVNSAEVEHWKAMYANKTKELSEEKEISDKKSGKLTILTWLLSIIGGVAAIIALIKFGLPKIPKL